MSYKDLAIQSLAQTPYERMLVACLVARPAANLQEIHALYKECQDKRLFQFAQEHECTSIVAARLQALGISTPQWDAALDDWKYRLSQRFEALDALADDLKAHDIPLIALKNAGIARGIYPYPEECPMGDFDVLVKKSDFKNAHQLVLNHHFELAFRAQQSIEKEGLQAGLISGGTEYKKDLADDTLWLELQWRPVAGRWIAPDVEPRADDLFKTAIPIQNSNVLLQDPVSNLLQVALHTAKHSYVRDPGLRLHSDVDRITRAYPNLDWNQFLKKTKQMHVKTAVFFALAIPKVLLHSPIPDDVLDQLEPPKFQRNQIFNALKNAGLFHPRNHKFSRIQYLCFTAVLFDSPSACLKSAFPAPNTMKQIYQFQSSAALPFYYLKRCANLIFKRAKT